MRKIAIISVLALMLAATGCANHAQYHAAQGAAMGALAGKAWGDGSDRDVLKGAAIGAGIGYGIGNEMDKAIMHRQIIYRDDEGMRYRGPAPTYQPTYNPGVEGAYHRGKSEHYRNKQREAERRARDRGRAGW